MSHHLPEYRRHERWSTGAFVGGLVLAVFAVLACAVGAVYAAVRVVTS